LSDYTMHVDFVRAGLGLALIPRLGRPPLPEDLIAVAPSTPPSRVVSIAVRASQADDPTVRVVADAVGGAVRRG
jgi:DNA-binding transcriptional LysR family regulator